MKLSECYKSWFEEENETAGHGALTQFFDGSLCEDQGGKTFEGVRCSEEGYCQ